MKQFVALYLACKNGRRHCVPEMRVTKSGGSFVVARGPAEIGWTVGDNEGGPFAPGGDEELVRDALDAALRAKKTLWFRHRTSRIVAWDVSGGLDALRLWQHSEPLPHKNGDRFDLVGRRFSDRTVAYLVPSAPNDGAFTAFVMHDDGRLECVITSHTFTWEDPYVEIEAPLVPEIARALQQPIDHLAAFVAKTFVHLTYYANGERSLYVESSIPLSKGPPFPMDDPAPSEEKDALIAVLMNDRNGAWLEGYDVARKDDGAFVLTRKDFSRFEYHWGFRAPYQYGGMQFGPPASAAADEGVIDRALRAAKGLWIHRDDGRLIHWDVSGGLRALPFPKFHGAINGPDAPFEIPKEPIEITARTVDGKIVAYLRTDSYAVAICLDGGVLQATSAGDSADQPPRLRLLDAKQAERVLKASGRSIAFINKDDMYCAVHFHANGEWTWHELSDWGVAETRYDRNDKALNDWHAHSV